MAIVQCENHHYYDDRRDISCPYCAKINADKGVIFSGGEQMTSYFGALPSEEEGQLTEAYGYEVEEYDKTIGIFTEGGCHQPTVGWLVCMNGAVKGKSYAIYSGRNFAGRSVEMDIALSDDKTISRENHFSIVYDPKSICYFLISGAGQTYLNGEIVREESMLKEGDEICAGDSKYIFVPFCKEGRVWD